MSGSAIPRRRVYLLGAGVLFCLGLAAVGGSAASLRQEQRPGLVAFETAYGIHLIRTDGTGLRRLRGTQPGDHSPRWSPDGRRLVFWRGDFLNGEIYVAGADGSGRRLLSRAHPRRDFEPSDSDPVWSPDGRLIAFASFRGGWLNVWLMRPDGSGLRPLTPGARGGVSPHWSPDGNRVVYAVHGDTARAGSASSLAVVDLSGLVRSLKTFARGDDFEPAWSPDGSRIAFESTADDRNGELYLVASDGGAPRRLTRNHAGDGDARHAVDADPRWSPDGEHILFTSGRAGPLRPNPSHPRVYFDEVYIMRADGTRQRRLTRNANGYACCADWRPEP